MNAEWGLLAETLPVTDDMNDGDAADAASLRLRLIHQRSGRVKPVNGGTPVYAGMAVQSSHFDVNRGRAMRSPLLFRVDDKRLGIVWISTDLRGRPDDHSTITATTTTDFKTFTPEIVLARCTPVPFTLSGMHVDDNQIVTFTYLDESENSHTIRADLPPTLNGPNPRTVAAREATPTCISDPLARSLRRKSTTAPHLGGHTFGPPIPLAAGIADPQIFRWQDKYLLVGTDDRHQIDAPGVMLRTANSISELKHAQTHLVVRADNHLTGCFWAPELHLVNDRLTLFFAPSISEAAWDHVQAYVTQLHGSDPTNPAHWTPAIPVTRPDGKLLSQSAGARGISLDMTYINHAGRHIVAWSQRQIHHDKEGAEYRVIVGDARIWGAEIDPQAPHRLVSEPVLLISPEHSWETCTSNVVEGPTFSETADRVYLTYSASNIDNSYCIGEASTEPGADLLSPSAWDKRPVPALRTSHHIDEIGPGHHQFVEIDDAIPCVTYHSRPTDTGMRNAYIRHSQTAVSQIVDRFRDSSAGVGADPDTPTDL